MSKPYQHHFPEPLPFDRCAYPHPWMWFADLWGKATPHPKQPNPVRSNRLGGGRVLCAPAWDYFPRIGKAVYTDSRKQTYRVDGSGAARRSPAGDGHSKADRQARRDDRAARLRAHRITADPRSLIPEGIQ